MKKESAGIVVATFIYLIGGCDKLFINLCIFVLVDYITGVMSAYKNKKLNSKIGIIGIMKKFCYFLAVIIGTSLDHVLGTDNISRNLIIYMLIANDGISILENLGKFGIKLPNKIKSSLLELKGEEEK